MTELQALKVKLKDIRNSFETNPKALALIREALTAVNLKIRVSGQEPYRAGGGAGAQPRAAEVAARARSASPLGARAAAPTPTQRGRAAAAAVVALAKRKPQGGRD